MSEENLSIDEKFVVLNPEKVAIVEACDSSLYERLEKNYNGFSGCELISCFEFERDWSSWEIHPNGDEIVILLSGEVTFVFQLDKEEKHIYLSGQGAYVIVPKNVWHTARTNVKTKMLFITPGEGTKNKDI